MPSDEADRWWWSQGLLEQRLMPGLGQCASVLPLHDMESLPHCIGECIFAYVHWRTFSSQHGRPPSSMLAEMQPSIAAPLQ